MSKEIKVLIAEDDPFIGMITKECFETKGFEVYLCEDGNKAFSCYLDKKPDVCILDVMMPLKDGFTLAKEIRSIDADIPILFLTAKSLKEDVIKGFKIGADDYVKKPFSVEELIARVDAIIRRSKVSLKDVNRQIVFQIGAFSLDSVGNYSCFGLTTFIGQGTVLTVYGDDQTTSFQDGFFENEFIYFFINRVS